MKNALIRFLPLLLLLSCTNNANSQHNHRKTLDDLKRHYVLQGRPQTEDSSVSDKFMEDSITYFNAITSFYTSDPTVIDYLISAFEKCEGLSGIIVPFSEYLSSEIDPCELVDCKTGALILIDNYL